MSNSFDNKVYDYIKSVGDVFPVGMRLKLSSKEPPSTGTWKLVGIYGEYSYTEDDVIHDLVFIGKVVIDCVHSGSTTNTEVSWTYDSIFGSEDYNINSVFGCYINTAATTENHTLSASLSDGTTTFSIKNQSRTITQTLDSSSDGAYAQIRINLTYLHQITISDDGLSYEYERPE